MDVILRPIFSILTVPDLKIKQPTWLHVCIMTIVWSVQKDNLLRVNSPRPPPPGPSLLSSSPPTSSSLVELSTTSLLNHPGCEDTESYYKYITCFLTFFPQCRFHYRWAWSHQTCCIHAIQGQRPVHHGGRQRVTHYGIWTDLLLGPCQQLYVLPGRRRSHGNYCAESASCAIVHIIIWKGAGPDA